MYRRFIFFRAGLSSVSPGVTVWWPGKVIDLFNQFPESALHYGSHASETCVDFIIACSQVKKAKQMPLDVANLPLRWEGQEQLTAEYATAVYANEWREWLFRELERVFAEIEDKRSLPILVDIDPPFHVTQGGTVLFQRLDLRDYKEGDPLWVTPAHAKQLAKARETALKRRPKPTGISVDEYEVLFQDRLTAAGFDFDRPDRKLACRVFLKCAWEPVACDRALLYYEARDDGIEFGRWFQHEPESGKAKHERVALRFASPKLRGYEFNASMGLCGNPADARTFAKMLSEVFRSGPDQIVSKWRVELRRYEPR